MASVLISDNKAGPNFKIFFREGKCKYYAKIVINQIITYTQQQINDREKMKNENNFKLLRKKFDFYKKLSYLCSPLRNLVVLDDQIVVSGSRDGAVGSSSGS